MLNPPYAQRDFSSVNFNRPMLDDLSGAGAWSPTTIASGQWMEIDAGQVMQLVGIITQGRGNIATHYVTGFTVQYRLGSEAPVVLSTVFTMTNGLKKSHWLPSIVNARYVRIEVTSWMNSISMRAALLVWTCMACLLDQVSLAGSTSAAACQCAANSFLDHSVVANRAIALFPRTTQVSTLARRSLFTYGATAVFDSSVAAGPPTGRGAVTFDRTLFQGLDWGAHTFNILRRTGVSRPWR